MRPICAYFVAEPAMAELATVGVYGAGPQALARRDRVIDSLAAMLAPGFEENPSAPAVSSEAIAATVSRRCTSKSAKTARRAWAPSSRSPPTSPWLPSSAPTEP
jgi:hypothetical protein